MRNLCGRFQRSTLLLSALVVFSGCDSSGLGQAPERHSVTGRVTVDDLPVSSGTITFVPSESGKGTSGKIVAGAFSIPVEAGLSKGNYTVQISSIQKTGNKIPDLYNPGQEIDEMAETIPERYMDSAELTVEVSESGPAIEDFMFELTSE